MRASQGSVTGLDPAAGALLLAGPRLTEPTFAGTVVLLLDHDEDGSLGVVLNRRTESRFDVALPAGTLAGFGDAAAAVGASPLHEGGPVDRTQLLSLIALGAGPAVPEDRMREVLPGVALVDLLGLAASGVGTADPGWHAAQVRAYVGYAGWGPGQLEREVEEEAWYVLPARREDPFTDAPERLWTDVVDRQEGRTAWLRWRPAEVTEN